MPSVYKNKHFSYFGTSYKNAAESDVQKQKSYFWGQRKGLIKLPENWKRVFCFLILVEDKAPVITVIPPNTRTANYVTRGYKQ